MRIVRVLDTRNETHHGQEHPDGRVTRVIGDFVEGFRDTGDALQVTRLLAPVEPTNIFCIGQNYRRHAEETGAEIPTYPVIFMKPTTTVIGPGEAIRIPASQMKGPEVDYECELAVVIGRTCRDVLEDKALDAVFGYTVANDVSARRWQKHGGGGQWIRGKSFDTFCPLGPAVVTADEIPDPQSLALSTTRNGTVLQSSRTADMIFSVAQIIAFLSRDTTLQPGTVILTGTPEGVGFTRQPPIWLEAGDEVTVEVEMIGRLTNPVQG